MASPPAPRSTTLEMERPLRASDASRIHKPFPHPAVLRYMASAIPWPCPEDGAATFLRGVLPKMEAGEEYERSILFKEHGEDGPVGLISLTPQSTEDHRGFWLGEAYWGRGLMREARAANDFVFDVLGMEALRFNNARPNVASHRLKASAGAEPVSIRESSSVVGAFPDGRWRLTAEAWRARRGAFRAGGAR